MQALLSVTHLQLILKFPITYTGILKDTKSNLSFTEIHYLEKIISLKAFLLIAERLK